MKPTFALVLLFFIVAKVLSQSNSIPPDRMLMIDQFLNQQKEASGFFMVGNGGEILFEKGLGYANREHLQLTIPGQDARTHLKIKLIFKENKIDRIGAEME